MAFVDNHSFARDQRWLGGRYRPHVGVGVQLIVDDVLGCSTREKRFVAVCLRPCVQVPHAREDLRDRSIHTTNTENGRVAEEKHVESCVGNHPTIAQIHSPELIVIVFIGTNDRLDERWSPQASARVL